MNPDAFSEAADALRTLSRTMTWMYPKPVVDGAQHSEDLRLEQLLPGDHGIFVDIGASWPRDCSNSIRFYDKGWRGLLIDPLPEVWGAILLERPEDFLCPIAVSDEEGFATLKICRAMSSLKQDWPTESVETMPVRTDTLANILKRYPSRDWSQTQLCSIDAEGGEAAILRGIDWNNFKPSVFVMEWASPLGEDISQEWRPLLEAQNYISHWRGSLNEIFRRK